MICEFEMGKWQAVELPQPCCTSAAFRGKKQMDPSASNFLMAPLHTYFASRAACCLQDPLASVAPRKANWDLRRDVAKKLEKLDRRTQRAMLTLMQQQQRDQIEADGGIRD